MAEPVVPETTQAAEQAAAGTQESAPLQVPEQKPAEGAESATAEEKQAEGTLKPEGTGSEPVKKVSDETVQELKTQREKRRLAEQEAAYWRGKAEGSQPPTKPAVQPQADKEPVLDDFDGPYAYEDWTRSRNKWLDRQENLKNSRQQEADTRTAEAGKKFSESYRQAMTDLPDLEEVLTSPTQPFPPLSDTVMEGIAETGMGAQILYFFHKNPTEGIRLAQMKPVAAVLELANIREKAKAALQPKIKKVTTAAPPLNPGSSGGTTVDTDLADLPMAEYQRRRDPMYNRVGGKLVPQ